MKIIDGLEMIYFIPTFQYKILRLTIFVSKIYYLKQPYACKNIYKNIINNLKF